MNQKSTAIEIKNVYKKYKNQSSPALNNFSLTIPKGGIFSILGPNGAGKTTLLRIIGTQLRQDSGYIKINGLDTTKDQKEIRKIVAVIPQEAKPQSYNTVWDLVYSFGRLRGLSKKDSKEKTAENLNLLGLIDKKSRKCGNLSGGLKRRLLLAMILMADADFFLLDEPTTGLDPIARKQTWDFIKKISEKGKTVLLTTHYLEEAEYLSDSIALIKSGSLLLHQSKEELLAHSKNSFTIELNESIPTSIDVSDLKIKETNGIFTLNSTELEKTMLIVKSLLEKGISLSINQNKIENLYFKYIEE